MDAKITLTRFGSTGETLLPAEQHVWILEVIAEGLNIPSEIFVYQIGSMNDLFPGDRFTAVASVNQLFEIPANAGTTVTTNTSMPYYRTAALKVAFRSPEEAESFWKKLLWEVEVLAKNWGSSFSLRASHIAEVTADRTDVQEYTMNPPRRLQLYYQPAGIAALNGSVQSITSPDGTLPGWLPESSAPAEWVKPSNAAFYYNIGKDIAVASVWPPRTPFSGHQLYRNGLLMPYGVVYQFTVETIWWLRFDPTTIPGYKRTTGQAEDGNAPWPLDFVSLSSPGSVSPIIVLTVF